MGKGIECTFHLLQDKIVETTLRIAPSSGINWRYAATPSSEVKSVIDQWMEMYNAKQQPDVLLPLVFSGVTKFTMQVLHALQAIPFGGSCTYHDIAKKLHKPQASRAIGQACGRNPFPLVIPCHRVLGKGNALGGFSCGIEIKPILLNFEGIAFTQ